MSAGEPRRVIVASTNHGKLAEIRSALDFEGWEFVTAAELAREPLEVEETGETFAENALLKARAYADAFEMPALADDSGLEVDALDGAPGVRSARYSGEGATDARNNEKLLAALAGVHGVERTARFRSVIALVEPDGTAITAEGACEGTSASSRGAAVSDTTRSSGLRRRRVGVWPSSRLPRRTRSAIAARRSGRSGTRSCPSSAGSARAAARIYCCSPSRRVVRGRPRHGAE